MYENYSIGVTIREHNWGWGTQSNSAEEWAELSNEISKRGLETSIWNLSSDWRDLGIGGKINDGGLLGY